MTNEIDIQKQIIGEFEKFYETNKKKLSDLSRKDEALLSFISGAQFGVNIVKSIEDEVFNDEEILRQRNGDNESSGC